MILGHLVDCLGVPLGLDKYALRSKRELLSFRHAETTPAVEECVIGGADWRLKLLDGKPIASRTGKRIGGHDAPSGCFELWGLRRIVCPNDADFVGSELHPLLAAHPSPFSGLSSSA